MISTILGIALILHGLIHLLGFVVPWRLVKLAEMPYKVTIIGGKVTVGDLGVRVIGVFWLLAALAFVVAGVGLLIGAPWWQAMTLGVTAFSLVLCVLGWPDSQFGAYINLVILGYLLLGWRFGWFS